MLNIKLDFNVQDIVSLSIKVNNLLLSYYNSEFKISHKSDDSPVTDADHSASELIIEQLHKITPGISVVSEENDLDENLAIIKEKSIYWLIDPLDGTSSFISKKGVFTVNIALIVNGIAVWGLISSPLDGTVYYNDLHSTAVYKFDGKTSSMVQPKPIQKNAIDFLVSHQNLNQNTQDFITHFKINTITPIPSAIKFALLAEGKGDIYPRFKDTCTWDTAAGQALLNAVGGDVVNVEGKSLRYNLPTVKNPHFIAISSMKLIDLFVNKL
jgi:3'(2'), 5'-bisphosphate nucleotidase